MLEDLSTEERSRRPAMRESPKLKQRDMLKAQVRMALLRHCYSEGSKEAKQLANLQVGVMMEMLQVAPHPHEDC